MSAVKIADFLQIIISAVKCPVCDKIIREPHTGVCGHNACAKCWGLNCKTCQICNKVSGVRGLVPNSILAKKSDTVLKCSESLKIVYGIDIVSRRSSGSLVEEGEKDSEECFIEKERKYSNMNTYKRNKSKNENDEDFVSISQVESPLYFPGENVNFSNKKKDHSLRNEKTKQVKSWIKIHNGEFANTFNENTKTGEDVSLIVKNKSSELKDKNAVCKNSERSSNNEVVTCTKSKFELKKCKEENNKIAIPKKHKKQWESVKKMKKELRKSSKPLMKKLNVSIEVHKKMNSMDTTDSVDICVNETNHSPQSVKYIDYSTKHENSSNTKNKNSPENYNIVDKDYEALQEILAQPDPPDDVLLENKLSTHSLKMNIDSTLPPVTHFDTKFNSNELNILKTIINDIEASETNKELQNNKEQYKEMANSSFKTQSYKNVEHKKLCVLKTKLVNKRNVPFVYRSRLYKKNCKSSKIVPFHYKACCFSNQFIKQYRHKTRCNNSVKKIDAATSQILDLDKNYRDLDLFKNNDKVIMDSSIDNFNRDVNGSFSIKSLENKSELVDNSTDNCEVLNPKKKIKIDSEIPLDDNIIILFDSQRSNNFIENVENNHSSTLRNIKILVKDEKKVVNDISKIDSENLVPKNKCISMQYVKSSGEIKELKLDERRKQLTASPKPVMKQNPKNTIIPDSVMKHKSPISTCKRKIVNVFTDNDENKIINLDEVCTPRSAETIYSDDSVVEDTPKKYLRSTKSTKLSIKLSNKLTTSPVKYIPETKELAIVLTPLLDSKVNLVEEKKSYQRNVRKHKKINNSPNSIKSTNTPSSLKKFSENVKFRSTPVHSSVRKSLKYNICENIMKIPEENEIISLISNEDIVEKATENLEKEFLEQAFESPIGTTKYDSVNILKQTNENIRIFSKKELQPDQSVNGQNVCIATSGLTMDRKHIIKNLCLKFQWNYTEEFTDEVSHLIVPVDKNNQCQRTLKYIQALVARIWILSWNWILKCKSIMTHIKEDEFEVLDNSGGNGPHILRKSHLKFYSNMTFYCEPPFTIISEKVLEKALLSMGAKVVENVNKIIIKNSKDIKMYLVEEGQNTQDDETFNLLAVSKNVVPVNVEWVYECLGSGKIENVGKWLLADPKYLPKIDWPIDVFCLESSDEEDI